MPAQLASGTVRTSWPASCVLRRLGTHSSSNTRICDRQIAGLMQRSDSQFPTAAREVGEELVEGVATFKIIEQRLEWDASAGQAGRPIISTSLKISDDMGLDISRRAPRCQYQLFRV